MSDCNFRTTLSYDDILLAPQYSDIESRSQISLDCEIGDNLKLSVPIMLSPMDTVVSPKMVKEVVRLGGTAILHRYQSIDSQLEQLECSRVSDKDIIGAAVASTDDFFERSQALVDAGVSFVCIDVAHGHHILVRRAIEKIKKNLAIHVMAGNVATSEGFSDLEDWGADSIRCGIGGGSICESRIRSASGVPNITTIMDCAKVAKKAKLIADGGIKNSGDIVKALAVGADLVMVGSMFAGCSEAPGDVFYENGAKRKVYRGMSSRESQMDWRGRSSAPEGISTTIPVLGRIEPIWLDVVGNIRSGLSYSGAGNIREFQLKAIPIIQTPAGQKESWTHILSRR